MTIDADFSLRIPDLIEYLIAFVISMGATYWLAHLKKSAQLQAINANFTTYLEQQGELKEATEEISQRLNRGTIQYQIKLAAMHEKKITAIESIYTALVEARYACQDYSTQSDKEKKQFFFEKYRELMQITDLNRIWIGSNVFDSICNISNQMASAVIKFSSSKSKEEYLTRNTLYSISEKQLEQLFNVQEGFYDYINKDFHEQIIDIIDTCLKELEADKCLSKEVT